MQNEELSSQSGSMHLVEESKDEQVRREIFAVMEKLPLFLTQHERFSTFWMSCSLFRSLFQELFIEILHLINFTSLPSHCLNVARINIYAPADGVFTILMAFSHLIWRQYQHKYRSYNLTLVFHLLEDDEKIADFIHRYLECSVDGTGLEIGIESDDLPAHDKFLRDIMCYKEFDTIGRPLDQGATNIWRLRPNRTYEARRKIIRIVFESTLIASILFLTLIVLPVGVAVMLPIFSDYDYVLKYPNCDPELDELFRQEKLAPFSVANHPHRLIALVLDLVETLVYWFDTFLAILTSNHLAYLFGKDLQIYWKEVHRKIGNNLHMARMLHDSFRDDSQASIGSTGQSNTYHHADQFGLAVVSRPSSITREGEGKFGTQFSYHHRFPREPLLRGKYRTYCCGCSYQGGYEKLSKARRRICDYRRRNDFRVARDNRNYFETVTWEQDYYSGTSSISMSVRLMKEKRLEQLEGHVSDLHAQIFDFFTQVERVDVAASDILTSAVAFWLGTFTALSFYLMLNQDVELTPSLRFLQIAGFFMISTLTRALLTLHRTCTKSYVILCSLMAYDQTTRKLDYIKLMAFFSGDRRRTSFTLFRTILFTPNTYVTMIGWSISCYFITYTFFGKTSKST